MNREEFRAQVVEYQCSHKCMGHAGSKGGCCTLDGRDFIIGPIRDVDAFLARLRQQLGREVERAEVLIDYDEGAKMFPGLASWRNPANFPALRVLPNAPRRPCRFYDVGAGMCSIYAARPEACRNYECHWLKGVLERVS